jgi:serine/threonine protein kinase
MQSFSCSLSGQIPNQENSRRMTKTPWNRISSNAKDLVQQMLLADPKQRPSARQLLDHSWFKVSHFGPISTLTQALMNFVVLFQMDGFESVKASLPAPMSQIPKLQPPRKSEKSRLSLGSARPSKPYASTVSSLVPNH